MTIEKMSRTIRRFLVYILNILVIGSILETVVSAGRLCVGYLMEGFNLERGMELVKLGTVKSWVIFFVCLLVAVLIAGYIGKIIWSIQEKWMDCLKLIIVLIYAFCWFLGNYEIVYMKMTVFITVLFICILYQSNHYKKMIGELEQMNLARDERSKKIEEMSRIRHDISNHLVAAGYGEGSEYTEEIVRRIDDVIPVTGISVLDTLIEYKKKICEEKNIRFECNRCKIKGERVELYDWVSIFGNVLDNAIEACDKAEADKFIKIKLFYHEDFLCMELRNSKSLPESTEKEKRLLPDMARYKDKRGLGLKIVNDILSKYDGMFSSGESENAYEIHIMLKT